MVRSDGSGRHHATRNTQHATLVSFGRAICGDLEAGLRREWLVTNGLGGYASGTVAGVATRRYHGLLVAALTPPVGRTVLVAGMDARASYDGKQYALSAHEYAGGTIDPRGYRYLESFVLDGALPVWTYALGDALLEQRIWMAYDANTTYLSFHLLRATRAVELALTPLVTCRDFHSLVPLPDWHPEQQVESDSRSVTLRASRVACRVLADGGRFTSDGAWWWNFYHRAEAARGLDSRSDLYAPGAFTATLTAGDRLTLVLTSEDAVEMDAGRALTAAHARQFDLLRRARAQRAHPVIRQLTLAADQLIVQRGGRNAEVGTSEESTVNSAFRPPRSAFGRTVIAGYHWFNDWGRDTMIALPGLALATGRHDEAVDILRTFAPDVRDGLLPNNFPDGSGQVPGYNTADATLWYVLAIRAYHAATGDAGLVDALLSVLCDIVEHHINGTRYGIAMDPADGLLRAGEPGVQLTWMDAKVGDWVVTPRTGKPVEINALWYNTLRTLAAFLKQRVDRRSGRYAGLADQARTAFRARFVRPGRAHLADVVDGPDGDDLSVRPNQVFAASLPEPLLEQAEGAAMIDAVGRDLLTSYGLRSLSPDDPAYHGDYGGDQVRRDGAYHQGPVWTWLIGPYAEAHYRVHGDREAALALLRPFAAHLRDAGLGSVSEIMEGDPPHLPRGCIAQAWSVAEVLRVWRMLEHEPALAR